MCGSSSDKQVLWISRFLVIGGAGVLFYVVAWAITGAPENMMYAPLVPYYVFVSLISMLTGPLFMWMLEPSEA